MQMLSKSGDCCNPSCRSLNHELRRGLSAQSRTKAFLRLPWAKMFASGIYNMDKATQQIIDMLQNPANAGMRVKLEIELVVRGGENQVKRVLYDDSDLPPEDIEFMRRPFCLSGEAMQYLNWELTPQTFRARLADPTCVLTGYKEGDVWMVSTRSVVEYKWQILARLDNEGR